MSVSLWIIIYVLNSLWWKWILSWSGAQWLEGWKAWFFLEWFTADWQAEQIRFYALLMWILTTLWFVVGLIAPAARFTGF
ncbi:hypothetical protein ACF3NA_01660 [Alkanindiges sp. WGS2144]|uniref:hypothetical protein n=1 Tax=Alkanindiges sp. WGS2144 TaxID=3366808 RepID=UPI0037513CCF